MTFSVNVILYSICKAEFKTSDLIMRADQALYRAKRENKDGCCMW